MNQNAEAEEYDDDTPARDGGVIMRACKKLFQQP